jgi:Flp pilus assembly protein TadD
LLKLERWEQAEKQFRVLLQTDPTHAGGNQGMSEALRRQGKVSEAVRFARRAAHWSQWRDPEILVTLGEAYIAAQRNSDARRTLDQALQFATQGRPDLVATIRTRLRQIQ